MSYAAGPFNGPHLYLQWGGGLPGGEIWSNGLRFAPPAGVPEINYDVALHNGYTQAVSDLMLRGTSCISPRATLTYVKLNKIGVDGKYADQDSHEQNPVNVTGGGNAGFTPANQISLAVSTLTAVARGIASRGRFYLPLPSLMVAADGLISAADQTNINGSVASFLAAINAVSANSQAAVMSRKLGNPGSRFITSMKVGRALDTQRRRRNSLSEKMV